MMNMRIAGSGTIPAGEYDKVSISGSGRLFGEVRCNNFSASGSTKGESVTCAEGFKVSGSSSFSGTVKAQNIRAAGSFSCDGDLIAQEQLHASGSLRVGGDLQAASVRIAGELECNGALCAKEAELQADKPMRLDSITGGNVRTRRKLISIFRKRRVSVTTAIEGDALDLEYLTTPRVTGQSVIIGKGCEIDLVQYRDELKISPKATVRKVEKI
jgi:cytoskeletal protein CcmA (bactofilin family)